MYANNAYGLKCSGSVDTDPIPELCWRMRCQIDFVFPMYEKLVSFSDTSM